jgi:hypothetical protein
LLSNVKFGAAFEEVFVIVTNRILPAALVFFLLAMGIRPASVAQSQSVPPGFTEAPAWHEGSAPARLNPFSQQQVSVNSAMQPAFATAVQQHARLGSNFANYYKSNGGRAYGDMRDAGASRDRITFDWFRFQPSAGGFDNNVVNAYNDLLKDAAAANIDTLGILIGAPEWARDDRYLGGAYRVPRGLELVWDDPNNTWGQFVFQIVDRYKDRVRAWEIWNEPNLTEFWPAPPALFAQLMRVAWQAAKAADPTTTVVFGGIYRGANIERIDAIFKALKALDPAGANAYYHDVIGYHLYDGGHCSVFDEIQYLRTFFWLPNVGDKPLWITESGIRVREESLPDFATPAESASFFITNYAYSLASGAQRYYYFRAVDDDPNASQLWGLLKNDGTARPSLQAMRTVAQWLPAQHDFVTRQFLNNDSVNRVSIYANNTRVNVLWNIGALPQTVTLPVGSPAVTLVTQEGNTSVVNAVNGVVQLTLGPAQNFRWGKPECQVASPPLIVVEQGVALANKVWLPVIAR